MQRTFKESILTYYIYNSNILEDILNINIFQKEIEKNIDFKKIRKVDLYFVSTKGCKTIGEVQLGVTDKTHLNQLIKNVKCIDNKEFSVIVWIAERFNKEYIDKIKQAINDKNILFYALKLNDKINAKLRYLSTLEDEKIVENIEVLGDIKNILKIDSCFMSNGYKSNNTNTTICLTNREMNLNSIYKVIKEELRDYYKINYSKSTLSRGYISCGMGEEDVALRLSIKADIAKIELLFSGKKKELFHNILIQKDTIIKELGVYVNFDEKLAKVSIKKKISKDAAMQDLSDIADVFCKMYRYFRDMLKKNNLIYKADIV